MNQILQVLGIFWHWFVTPLGLGGTLQVKPIAIVQFLVLLAAIWWGARWLRSTIRGLLGRRLGAAQAYAISRITYYALLTLGVLVALQTVGVDLSSLSVLGGVVGVGLGFGLQNIFSNFASGLILLMERSIEVGDYIQIKENGLHGKVMHIAVRYTQILTNDSLNVLVPNSQLVNNDVINWSMEDPTLRFHIPFRVPYGTPREALRDLVIKAAKQSPHTLDLPNKRPDLWITAFGEAGYDCALIVWVDREALMRPGSTEARYHWLLADALEAAGIEIPRPRQEIALAPGVAAPLAAAVSELSSSSSST